MSKKKPTHTEQTNDPNGAAGHMNKALLEQSNKIRDIIAGAEKHDVLARYEAAVAIRELRDAAKYGANAMQKLADFLGWSLTTVNDYARIAEVWPDAKKFATVAEKPNCNGIPLSWTHFTILMREEDVDRRRHLMDQALKRGWTVAELDAQRKPAPVGPGAESTARAEDGDEAGDENETKPATPLMAVVNGMTEKLTQLKTAWESDLPNTIAKAPIEELDDVLKSLKEARKQHEEALKSIDMAIVQVEEKQKLGKKKEKKPAA
jgi:hypothetical protein